MNCPKCGSENPESNRFCDHCGTKLAAIRPAKEAAPKRKDAPRAVELPAPAPVRAESAPAVPAAAGSLAAYLTWENLLWVALLLVGAALRFYALGDKPLHHDESLHAFYSWNLFKGNGYAYDPMMHGPFLFHANALIYFLFGATDFTCRILPVLFSMLCIAMAWALRPYLGRAGAFATGLILTLSPSFIYFGRFIRNDIYIAGFSIVMLYGLFKHLEARKPAFLYWAAAALSLAFCTKEVTYIIGFIFVSLLFFRWVWEQTLRTPGETHLTDLFTAWRVNAKPLWVSTAIFFAIVTVLYTTVFTNPRGLIDAFSKSLTYWLGQHEVQRGSQPVYFYGALLPWYETIAVLGSLAAMVYFSFIKDRANRVWRLLGYLIVGSAWWLFAMQGKQTFGLVFSLVLVTLGTGLLAYFSFNAGNFFITFLITWTLAAFSDFSFAGERMPWLILHPLLPMVLLTGMFIGEVWDRFPVWRKATAAVTALLLALLLQNAVALTYYMNGANPAEQLVYVQSSIDATQVARQITNMSRRLTGGLDMKITCEDYCSWPFAWYLRDFKNVGYPKFTANQAEGSIEKNPLIITGVEMAAPGHDERVAQLLAADYVAQRYKLRVWWAADANAFFNDTLGGQLKKLWRLVAYREPWSGLGSYDMIIYVRKDVAYLFWSHAE